MFVLFVEEEGDFLTVEQDYPDYLSFVTRTNAVRNVNFLLL